MSSKWRMWRMRSPMPPVFRSSHPPPTPYHCFAFRFLLHMDSPARRVVLARQRFCQNFVSRSPAHACCSCGACVLSLVSVSVQTGGMNIPHLISSEHHLIPPPFTWLLYVTTCLLPLRN